MRSGWGVILLVGLAGCTTYQPVAWDGHGSWAEALWASRAAPPPRPAPAPAQVRELPRASTPVARRAPAEPVARPSVAQRELPPPPARPKAVAVAALEPMPAAPAPLPRTAGDGAPPPLSGNGFLWPVRGKIVSPFGGKPNGTRNNGINIRAAEGAPVLAAENGVVVYAGEEIPGYGRMLLLSHAQGFLTAYAHNRDLAVAVGDRVDRGQQIATVGRTGNVTTPQLHFELREGRQPIDPVALLESATTQVASAS